MIEKAVYSVAAYCRFSKELDGKAESMSIENQKKMLSQYAQERGWLIHNFYIDDGVTGTTFVRDGIMQLMEDVKNGVVDCVILKDANCKQRIKIKA